MTQAVQQLLFLPPGLLPALLERQRQGPALVLDYRDAWSLNPLRVGTAKARRELPIERWVLRGRSARWRVDVEGHGALGDAHVLPVPLPAESRNIAGAIEHLGATMRVRVRQWGRLTWEGTSRVAALEHGGIDRASAEIRRRGGSPDATDAPPLGR